MAGRILLLKTYPLINTYFKSLLSSYQKTFLSFSKKLVRACALFVLVKIEKILSEKYAL